MTETWSKPWHALQRSLAGEVQQRLPKRNAAPLRAIADAAAMNSWLVRALGGDSAASLLRR